MEIVEGQISHDGKILELGSYHVIREINRGANGIVYEAVDKYLQRKVAIKIWTKLRPLDKRDKIEQGIAEARKAHSAEHEHVLEIYHAGITCGLFFMVMEYFDGIPIRQYIHETRPPLGRRVPFARKVLSVCWDLHDQKIFHGDLHSNNVLIREKKDLYAATYGNDITLDDYPDFKIIDFGTSHFAHRSFSENRYLNQIISFANEFSKPFLIQPIYGYAYPKDINADLSVRWNEQRLRWIFQYYDYLPKALFKLGYLKGERWHYESLSFTDPIFPVPEKYLVNLEKLLKSGIPLHDINGWSTTALV